MTTSTAPVTVALQQNPAGGTLSGTLTRNAVAGVATFNNLSVNTVGTGYTLSATTTLPDVTPDQTDFFVITPASLPSAPTALITLSDTVASNGQLQLGWSYAQGAVAATGFVVERQEGCGGAFTARPGMPIALTPLNYTETGLGGAEYVLLAGESAECGGGLSAPSNSVQRTGTVVPPPTNLTISLFSTGNFLAR